MQRTNLALPRGGPGKRGGRIGVSRRFKYSRAPRSHSPPEAPHHIPENPRSEAQILTARYVDCHTDLGRTKPNKRLVGQEATEIADQLRLVAAPNTMKRAIRVQVEEG